jgi:small ligand-binding sensory domain FIST
LWAGRFGAATPLRLNAHRHDGGVAVTGFPPASEVPAHAGAVLLLADPFSFPADIFLEALREQVGVDLPVIGGLASAARGPGGNRLVLDGTVVSDGAVGVILEGVEVATVVSQGCRPIGDPMTVTSGERQIVYELAGRPALERVQELVASLSPDDLALVERGLHVGRVIDEHKLDYGRGDFLIRNVLGADHERRAVAVGDEVDVGGALLFTCNGRGSHLFGTPDHDAGVISDALGGVPLAGMSCAGEIGPVGGRSFLHGFTASVALFSDRRILAGPTDEG